jgi:hypothetical protein
MTSWYVYQNVDLANRSSEWVKLDYFQCEESAINYVRRMKELNPSIKFSLLRTDEVEVSFEGNK